MYPKGDWFHRCRYVIPKLNTHVSNAECIYCDCCCSIYGSDTGINFFSFFIFSFPHMIIILLVCWLSLVLMFIGPKWVNLLFSLLCLCLYRVEALSDDAVSCLSVICLTSVAYIGPKSRTERPRKNKIGTEVAHITHDLVTTFKVKGQLVVDVLNSQYAGTGATWRINMNILSTCRGQTGGGILWQSPAQLVIIVPAYWSWITVCIKCGAEDHVILTVIFRINFPLASVAFDNKGFWCEV